MIDASFETISEISPLPNSDRLELINVSGWPVIIAKDTYKVGDKFLYIREDAQLTKDFEKFPWQVGASKYTSSSGRVKIIKLRGKMSAGLCVSMKELGLPDSTDTDELNNKIKDPAYGPMFLLDNFGIKHFTLEEYAPDQAGPLPFGLCKSDENNVQEYFNSSCDEIPWGEKCLVTKKIDGQSMMIDCCPSGEVKICGRRFELKQDDPETRHMKAAAPVRELGVAWAKRFGTTIALRGELTASNVQKLSFNKDKDINNGYPTFHLYGCEFPELTDEKERDGRFGTKFHFLEINKQIAEITHGKTIRTVPILGEEILTKELCQEYIDKPKSFGEGVVLNFNGGIGSCKAKSAEYMGKVAEVL